jgi:hypothetical protein
MKVGWFVPLAMLGLACLSQVAEAKSDSKEFTATKVENAEEKVSVAVTKIKLHKNGVMNFELLVKNDSAGKMTVNLKGFVLSAGGKEIQRDAKLLASGSVTIEPRHPATIKFDFMKVDPKLTEAALEMKGVFKLGHTDVKMDDMKLTLGAGGGGGQAASDDSAGGGGQATSDDSTSQ